MKAKGLRERSVEDLKLTRLCFDAERLLPARAAFEPLGSVDLALVSLQNNAPTLLGVAPRHAGAISEALGRIEAELREPRLGHELLLRAQLLELLVVLARAEHTPAEDPARHRPRRLSRRAGGAARCRRRRTRRRQRASGH